MFTTFRDRLQLRTHRLRKVRFNLIILTKFHSKNNCNILRFVWYVQCINAYKQKPFCQPINAHENYAHLVCEGNTLSLRLPIFLSLFHSRFLSQQCPFEIMTRNVDDDIDNDDGVHGCSHLALWPQCIPSPASTNNLTPSLDQQPVAAAGLCANSCVCCAQQLRLNDVKWWWWYRTAVE